MNTQPITKPNNGAAKSYTLHKDKGLWRSPNIHTHGGTRQQCPHLHEKVKSNIPFFVCAHGPEWQRIDLLKRSRQVKFPAVCAQQANFFPQPAGPVKKMGFKICVPLIKNTRYQCQINLNNAHSKSRNAKDNLTCFYRLCILVSVNHVSGCVICRLASP